MQDPGHMTIKMEVGFGRRSRLQSFLRQTFERMSNSYTAWSLGHMRPDCLQPALGGCTYAAGF